MSVEKQKLFLSYLIANPDLFVKVNAILNPGYFDPKVKPAVSFIKDYYDQYRATPSQNQIKAETGVAVEDLPVLTNSELKYAEDKIEEFCKHGAIETAILSSPKLLADGDFGKIEEMIKSAVSVSLNRNIGLNYFADPTERLTRLLTTFKPLPTGYLELDTLIGGGFSRKELTIFSANSGVGKSIFMSNIAVNYVLSRIQRCIYFARTFRGCSFEAI